MVDPIFGIDYFNLFTSEGGRLYSQILGEANRKTLAEKLGREEDGQIRIEDVQKEFRDSAFSSLEDFVDYVENRNPSFFALFSNFILTDSMYQKAVGLLGGQNSEKIKVDLNDPEQQRINRFFRLGYFAEIYSAYLEARKSEELESLDDYFWEKEQLDRLSALPLSDMEYVFIEEGDNGDLIAFKEGVLFVYEEGLLPSERYQQFPKHDYEEMPQWVKDAL